MALQDRPLPKIDVVVAAPIERPILENLFQLYTHDFSVHWAGTSKGELDADGRFAPYPLEHYWRDADRIPLLFRREGNLVGCALLNSASPLGGSIEHNMAEFFVVRKHRGAGVGAAAARAILDRYPGEWTIAVARKNVDALAFWRKVLASVPARLLDGLAELEAEGPTWTGPVFRFRTITPR
jgi:predicted acetyltransferase